MLLHPLPDMYGLVYRGECMKSNRGPLFQFIQWFPYIIDLLVSVTIVKFWIRLGDDISIEDTDFRQQQRLKNTQWATRVEWFEWTAVGYYL